MPYLLKHQMNRYISDVLAGIRRRIYEPIGDLCVEAWTSDEPLKFEDRRNGKYINPEADGEKWGYLFGCAWFHFTGNIDAETVKKAKGRPVFAQLDVGGEGLIADAGGNPIQGLTAMEANYDKTVGLAGKRIFPLFGSIKGGETIDLWIDAGFNNLDQGPKGASLKMTRIVSCNIRLRELFYDMQVLYDLFCCTDDRSPRSKRILFKLYEACCLLHDYREEPLLDEVFAIIKPELNKQGGTADLNVSAIGHAHIDLAWLWPIRETKRKGARTFATVLKLMDEYPDYKFGASQPQLFQWIKEEYPSLYERFKEKVLEGRIEVQGGMWVEADTNVISGESLVRQLLYGMRFFEEEFGITVNTLWLPDVFGYSAALPQILKKCDIPYFMTQKLSWNQVNTFPHYSFWWEGIDGTRVLTHMLPEHTYNSPMSPCAVREAEHRYADSGVSENMLMLFGIGDGGGGPGREHLERAGRMQNLSGLPKVKQEFAADFFKRLAKESKSFKTWKGELYLERHQGTYTTQAENKRYNRRMELALRELEFAASMDGGMSKEEKHRLDEIWKEVLLYQFHDIIPGSSVDRVYNECLPRYAALLEETNTRCKAHYKHYAENFAGRVFFNSMSWSRSLWITDKHGKSRYLTVPAMGCAAETGAEEQSAKLYCGENRIENEYLSADFGADGSLIGLHDKTADRQVLTEKAGELRLYKETVGCDCWDISMTYRDTPYDVMKLEKQSFGKDNTSVWVCQKYAYKNSSAVLTVSLESKKPLLNYDLEINWQDTHYMLRTEFPVDVHTDTASYEIQFGKLNRPNHDNTTWDMAKFETCGQRWVDISQPDYGVALLNDCKYGHRIKDNVLDLNLLRGQVNPGNNADKGIHRIRYALYPHSGTERDAKVAQTAYEYNVPVISAEGNGMKTSVEQYIAFEGGCIVDTVKPAEDGEGIAVRLYEPYGQSAVSRIALPSGCTQCFICDLREANRVPAAAENGFFVWKAKPFEILTLLFK